RTSVRTAALVETRHPGTCRCDVGRYSGRYRRLERETFHHAADDHAIPVYASRRSAVSRQQSRTACAVSPIAGDLTRWHADGLRGESALVPPVVLRARGEANCRDRGHPRRLGLPCLFPG